MSLPIKLANILKTIIFIVLRKKRPVNLLLMGWKLIDFFWKLCHSICDKNTLKRIMTLTVEVYFLHTL